MLTCDFFVVFNPFRVGAYVVAESELNSIRKKTHCLPSLTPLIPCLLQAGNVGCG